MRIVLNKIAVMASVCSLVVSCGNGDKGSSSENNNPLAESQAGNLKSSSSFLPIIGTSFTKNILIKTNSKKSGKDFNASADNSMTQKDFDKELHLSAISKIDSKRAEFSKYELRQNFILKAAGIAVDTTLDVANVLSNGAATVIVEPLKAIRSNFFDAAISATIMEHNIQIGRTIELLAHGASGELVEYLKSFNGKPEAIDQIRKELIAEAKKQMTPNDADYFISQLNDQYLVGGLSYVSAEIKNINSSMKTMKTDLENVGKMMRSSGSKLDQINYELKTFAENNEKFMREQKELLKSVKDGIEASLDNNKASLVKLDFLTYMLFGNLPASMQLDYLNNSGAMIPLSKTEKQTLISSLEFKVKAEKSIELLSSFKTISTNLDFLGKDGRKAIDISTTLLSSVAAVTMSKGSPIGYMAAVANISSLFAKGKADPRLDIILENQKKIFDALSTINDNLNSLRMELYEGFKKLGEEIIASREIQLSKIRDDDLLSCNVISNQFGQPTAFDDIKAELISDGGEVILSECLLSLTKLFSKTSLNNNSTFTRYLSYKESEVGHSVLGSYGHILKFIERESPDGLDNSRFDLEKIIDPALLSFYITELVNNHHWFDLAKSTPDGWRLVDQDQLAKNIVQNKLSERMLINALRLVEHSLYQHRVWSGLVSLDFHYENYLSAQGVNCKENPENVVCISQENPWFFNNLFNYIMQKNVGYDYFFSSSLVAPNDPDYLNEKIPGPFKLVWIGKGASHLYKGEVISDPKVVSLYGEGVFVKVPSLDKTIYYPIPHQELLKKRKSIDLPKVSILLKLKKILQDELLDMNLSKTLEENEYSQFMYILNGVSI